MYYWRTLIQLLNFTKRAKQMYGFLCWSPLLSLVTVPRLSTHSPVFDHGWARMYSMTALEPAKEGLCSSQPWRWAWTGFSDPCVLCSWRCQKHVWIRVGVGLLWPYWIIVWFWTQASYFRVWWRPSLTIGRRLNARQLWNVYVTTDVYSIDNLVERSVLQSYISERDPVYKDYRNRLFKDYTLYKTQHDPNVLVMEDDVCPSPEVIEFARPHAHPRQRHILFRLWHQNRNGHRTIHSIHDLSPSPSPVKHRQPP